MPIRFRSPSADRRDRRIRGMGAFGPREILQQRGAEVMLASLEREPIQATVHDDPGKTIRPDMTIDEADADDFDALILPGGFATRTSCGCMAT